MQTGTFNGTQVQIGDTVKATLVGKVDRIDGTDDIRVDVDGYGGIWLESPDAYEVKVTKKAPAPEPKAKDAVVVTESGDRYVKRMDGKWHHIHKLTYWGSVLGSVYTWEELNRDYLSITELGTNQLPKDHTVRDLKREFTQDYKRTTGGVTGAKKTATGLYLCGYTLLPGEAVALAWDILKAYDKVQ